MDNDPFILIDIQAKRDASDLERKAALLSRAIAGSWTTHASLAMARKHYAEARALLDRLAPLLAAPVTESPKVKNLKVRP